MAVNIWRIAIFVMLLQVGITVASTAQIPLSCLPDDKATCIMFNMNTMTSTTIQNIIQNQVDSGQYKTIQVETDITTDIYLATSNALAITMNAVFSAAVGMFAFIIFVFGSSVLSVFLAGAMQSVVYIYYIRAAASLIKPGKGDI